MAKGNVQFLPIAYTKDSSEIREKFLVQLYDANGSEVAVDRIERDQIIATADFTTIKISHQLPKSSSTVTFEKTITI